jgi:cyclopropane fatty-acyl-phospholipid synthase-like methyltransferase
MSTSAFDSSAKQYDSDFTNSKIGRLQRQSVYKYLFPLLNKNTKILEINCGTGHDAITLAPKVNSILATDISEKMIEIAEQKNKYNNLKFEIQDIKNLHQNLSSNFDLLFSNFGGLNCLNADEIKSFGKNISNNLHFKAKVVLVVMGKKCWMENLWYKLQKDERLNRRNTKDAVPTKINESTFNTYYYSPAELIELLQENYSLVKVRPVGLFIPPSYLESLFKSKLWILNLLNALEKLIGNFSFLSNYADHYLIILEKK